MQWLNAERRKSCYEERETKIISAHLRVVVNVNAFAMGLAYEDQALQC